MREVILIGASNRMLYEPVVKEILEGKASVWGPEENCGDSRTVLSHLDEWALSRPADVIHFHFAGHDLKVLPDGSHQVPIDEFIENLRRVIDQLKTRTEARLIWATQTPIIDERHQRVKSIVRHEADVLEYNAAALEVVHDADITVNDLHAVIVEGGVEKCLCEDGVHLSDLGKRLAAEAVAAAVMA